MEHEARATILWLTGKSCMMHFLVDGLCACCLFLLADSIPNGSGSWDISLLTVFLIYNVVAFLTQPLTGMMADCVHHRELLLHGAVALLAFGVAVLSFTVNLPALYRFGTLVTAIVLGLGNSLFHVWGGRQVAVTTANDIRALGFFVSTGAFGLAVGMLFHAWTIMYLLIVMIAFLAIIPLGNGPGSTKLVALSPFLRTLSTPWIRSAFIWCSVLALMGIVMLRALSGEFFTAGMEKDTYTVLIVGLVTMIGKGAGGFLVSWFGIVRTIVAVVVCIAACLLLKGPALLGLLLVSLTMPVTLWLINVVMPGREGLAFGLLAAALMPGYLLSQMPIVSISSLFCQILSTLIPTIVLELVVLWLLRERRADVLWSSVVVNMLTNVPLHLFVVFVSSSLLTLVVGELLVLAVEMMWYRYFVNSWRQAFVYSSLCNGTSCLTGLLFQQILLLFTL